MLEVSRKGDFSGSLFADSLGRLGISENAKNTAATMSSIMKAGFISLILFPFFFLLLVCKDSSKADENESHHYTPYRQRPAMSEGNFCSKHID